MYLLDELTAERTHYPVEQTIVALSDDFYDWEDVHIHQVVCGCDERWGYKYGTGEHV